MPRKERAVLLSGLAARTVLSTSLLFLVGGALVSDGFLGLIHITPDSEIVSVTADRALFAVLFTDGMHVSFAELRANWRNPARALGLGMPLAVVDEKHADRLCEALAGRRVGDCLSSKAEPPPVADPDDTALEVAALMAQVRSPVVAVAEKAGGRTRLLGVITASHLLHELLGVAGTARGD
ncbi:CBS domain-containing protein [Streptomyces sp. S.PB5]|uniref:CBS domain-containing protein n=1 Tax=Streptomyces sp. S.PB5 TaxID=3020844 RepID=UPI0025AFF206|nr:CBS domain-containing protein [Streptomyces sp. S.PB5]MDN3023529.1 CBS domain-containing protein [Streptomyces sp. S.PB5]